MPQEITEETLRKYDGRFIELVRYEREIEGVLHFLNEDPKELGLDGRIQLITTRFDKENHPGDGSPIGIVSEFRRIYNKDFIKLPVEGRIPRMRTYRVLLSS